jgi:hypothetical protein
LSEKGKQHYSTPFKGNVEISNLPYPESGDFHIAYDGTSTERGWRDRFVRLLPKNGYTAKELNPRKGRTFGEAAANVVIEANQDFLMAFARSWEIDSKVLSNSMANIQGQIYSKVEPNNGFAFEAEAACNNIDNYWMTMGKYYLASKYNLAYIPLMEGVAIYYDLSPSTLFHVDSQHMTDEYLYFLASMTYTSRTGKLSNTTDLSESNKFAVQLGHDLIKKIAFLSDTGDYVAEAPIEQGESTSSNTTDNTTDNTTNNTTNNNGEMDVFSDISDYPFKNAINQLANLKILNGYPDNTFKPTNEITRAEFSVIMCYLLGKEDIAKQTSISYNFSDLSLNHWAGGFIKVLKDEGYIKGYPDNTFRPNNKITHAEAITVLSQIAARGIEMPAGEIWYEPFMKFAEERGILEGITFTPSKNILRGEVSQMTYKAYLMLNN